MKTKLKTSKILILLFTTITTVYTNLSYAAVYDPTGNENRIPQSEPTFAPKNQILIPKYSGITNTGNGKYKLVIIFRKKGGHEDTAIDIYEDYKVCLYNEEEAIKALTVNEETIKYSGNCKDGEIGPEGSTCTVTMTVTEEENLSYDNNNSYDAYQVDVLYKIHDGENPENTIKIKNKIKTHDIKISFDKGQLAITNSSSKILTIVEITNPSKHLKKIDTDIDGNLISENNEHNKFTLKPNDDPRVFPLTQSELPCDSIERCKCNIIVVYKIKGDQKEKKFYFDGLEVEYNGNKILPTRLVEQHPTATMAALGTTLITTIVGYFKLTGTIKQLKEAEKQQTKSVQNILNNKKTLEIENKNLKKKNDDFDKKCEEARKRLKKLEKERNIRMQILKNSKSEDYSTSMKKIYTDKETQTLIIGKNTILHIDSDQRIQNNYNDNDTTIEHSDYNDEPENLNIGLNSTSNKEEDKVIIGNNTLDNNTKDQNNKK